MHSALWDQVLQFHFSYSSRIFLKQINVCLSSIYNDTNKPNFEKLEKIGYIPVYSNQHHIFPKDAAK